MLLQTRAWPLRVTVQLTQTTVCCSDSDTPAKAQGNLSLSLSRCCRSKGFAAAVEPTQTAHTLNGAPSSFLYSHFSYVYVYRPTCFFFLYMRLIIVASATRDYYISDAQLTHYLIDCEKKLSFIIFFWGDRCGEIRVVKVIKCIVRSTHTHTFLLL